MRHATRIVRLRSACVALAAALLAPTSLAATALAPFIDLQEAGLTMVVDGEGLQNWDHTTPRNLSVNVGGTVRFALLYWNGSEFPCNFDGTNCTFVQPFDDQQVIFNGTPITGTVIGTETWADHPGGERLAIGYFADVTSLVSAAGTGLQSFTFADGNLAANLTELDGVSLVVAYTNAADDTFYRVLVWDNLDFASGLAASGAPRVTAAVSFSHGAAGEPRDAELTLITGDGDASCDRVTVTSNPDLVNTLDGSAGPDWDADTHLITIPADVDTTTVQVHAEPDDLLWQMAMLRVAVPPAPAPVVAPVLVPTVDAGQVDTQPPSCDLVTIAGPPFQVVFTVQDTGSGLVSLVVTVSANADTVVPPFIPGSTDPVTVTSTKIDQTQPLAIEMTLTDGSGNTAICDYVEGLVTIVKDTAPDDPQDFTFLGSQSIGTFELDDEGGGDATLPSATSFIVPIGSYCVAEAVAPGFDLTGIVCDDPTANSVGDVPNRTAHVDVGSLEEVTCTFTNTDASITSGTLIVVKDTVPDGPQDFAFTGSGTIGAFTLDDDAGADATFTSSASFVLAPGAYTVTEAAVAGFGVTGIVCDDTDSTGDTATRTAAVALALGETVTCTFTNTAAGSLTIVQDTVPDGPQDFAYTGSPPIGGFTLDDDADATLPSSTTFSLPPGAYTVTQAIVPGFPLGTIVCSDDDSVENPATRTAAVALAPGETLTCTFTNRALPTLAEIPTLGEWAALLLGLALAGLGAWRLRAG